jgi:hypothetical protein
MIHGRIDGHPRNTGMQQDLPGNGPAMMNILNGDRRQIKRCHGPELLMPQVIDGDTDLVRDYSF